VLSGRRAIENSLGISDDGRGESVILCWDIKHVGKSLLCNVLEERMIDRAMAQLYGFDVKNSPTLSMPR
jgi:hypothetical protein